VKDAHTKDIAESSAQGQARGTKVTNDPYCYRFLTRGHPKQESIMTSFCDICECVADFKGRCPLLKKAKSMYALMCGYAVDGLGFYYILNSVAVRPRAVAKKAIVRVVAGDMCGMQVKMEMERLVPTKMTWDVEEIEDNMFKTVFPSKGDMQQMIEWGVLQTKDRKANLVIEELGGGRNIKQVIKKVWVQMAKFPSELRDFLNIWAIGTILGVTKDVDMIFTQLYN
jgi:hypothetical protein